MNTTTQKNKILLFALVIFSLLAACGPTSTTANGKMCIMPKLSAIPKEIPLYWDTNEERNPRKVPSRESIPSWMVPQLSLQQQKSIPPTDYSIDMAVDNDIFWMAYCSVQSIDRTDKSI
jgi:hypothetical protein